MKVNSKLVEKRIRSFVFLTVSTFFLVLANSSAELGGHHGQGEEEEEAIERQTLVPTPHQGVKAEAVGQSAAPTADFVLLDLAQPEVPQPARRVAPVVTQENATAAPHLSGELSLRMQELERDFRTVPVGGQISRQISVDSRDLVEGALSLLWDLRGVLLDVDEPRSGTVESLNVEELKVKILENVKKTKAEILKAEGKLKELEELKEAQKNRADKTRSVITLVRLIKNLKTIREGVLANIEEHWSQQ